MSNNSKKVLDRLAGRESPDYARIRKLRWYTRWKDFSNFLDTNPSKAETLHYVDKLIDKARGYRFAHVAGASLVALELLLDYEKR